MSLMKMSLLKSNVLIIFSPSKSKRFIIYCLAIDHRCGFINAFNIITLNNFYFSAQCNTDFCEVDFMINSKLWSSVFRKIFIFKILKIVSKLNVWYWIIIKHFNVLNYTILISMFYHYQSFM